MGLNRRAYRIQKLAITLILLLSVRLVFAQESLDLPGQVPTFEEHSLEFKNLGRRIVAKIKFREKKDRLGVEFEGDGLPRGQYLISWADTCPKAGAALKPQSKKLGGELTQFSINADAISHEASNRERNLKTNDPASLIGKAVVLLRKTSSGLRVLSCDVLK